MSVVEKNVQKERLAEHQESKPTITPDEALKLTKITKEFLCKPDDNTYEIEFTHFKIRDLESKRILFEITKPLYEQQSTDNVEEQSASNEDSSPGRYIRYQFTPNFLKLKTVGATV